MSKAPRVLSAHYNADGYWHFDSVLIKKLVLMYDYDIILARKHDRYKHLESHISLANWVSGDKCAIFPILNTIDGKDFDLLNSEWANLEIVRKVIECIKTEYSSRRVFSFDSNEHALVKFYNCAPGNFEIFIEPREKHGNKKIVGWSDFKDFFSHDINLSIKDSLDDARYDVVYFNKYGLESIEKRQVFSLVTLLVTLLSGNLSFSPVYNRRDSIDRPYAYILEKINGLNISSYTRAVVVGALSYREFERNNMSIFDKINCDHYDSDKDEPVKIENISEFESCVKKAQGILDMYQLSLEDQAPRQLIPISLVNLSRTYTPYDEVGEPNEQV